MGSEEIQEPNWELCSSCSSIASALRHASSGSQLEPPLWARSTPSPQKYAQGLALLTTWSSAAQDLNAKAPGSYSLPLSTSTIATTSCPTHTTPL